MKTHIAKDTLFNYFAGRSTVLQKQLIDQWAKEEPNQEFFFECLALWESQNVQLHVDAGKALERHLQRLNEEPTETIETGELDEVRPLWSRARLFWMIAASVTGVLLVLGALFSDQLMYKTYRSSERAMRLVNLPDGSQVKLKANSQLRVPRFGFGSNSREVMLAGEADFTIRHLPDHRNFVVQTAKNFKVVVLGTEFLVSTREHSEKVILNKGKVRLLYQEGQVSKQLTMKPGNEVTFDRNGHLSLQQTPESIPRESNQGQRFVFNQTTLEEISTLFANKYGLQVQFADKELAHWTISGAFTAANADELLDILSVVSNLNYRRQGNLILISPIHN